jgi:probable HAF family extracellular repeat protein
MTFDSSKWAMLLAVVCGFASERIANAASGDIYNLGTLGGPYPSASQINDAGQVSGSAQIAPGGDSRAFRYSGIPGAGGTMVDLGALSGSYSVGYGINNSGQVTGYSTRSDGYIAAFRYSGTPGSGGAMADLGFIGGGSFSTGFSINNSGQVAGYSSTTGGNRAFRYTGTPGAGGVMANLGTLGGTVSEGYGINTAGQVAGYATTTGDAAGRAFRYTGTPGAGGAMADLGSLGGTTSWARGINDAGDVVGWSYFTLVQPYIYTPHAFRYSGTPGAGGAMVDLGTLGGISSQAFDINDAGFIVGIAERSPAAGGGSWPALWRPGNTTIDLDAWLDATNPTLGAFWTLDGASDINNSGLITGTGTYNDGPGGLSDGQRPFILNVSGLVPEPSGVALLGLILPSLLRRSARRCK